MKKFRNDLIAARKNAAGLSLRQISKETGVAINTVRKVLAGDETVSSDKLEKVALFFGLDWQKLHTFEKVKKNEKNN